MVTSFFYIWTSQLQSSKKVHAIPMAIPFCLFVSFPPSQPHHLSQIPNFITLRPYPTSYLTNFPTSPTCHIPPFEAHHLPTFLTFPNSPPSHLQLKHFKIIALGLPSPPWFLREGSQYQNWKAKSLFSPPRKQSQTTGFELWFAKLHHWNMFNVSNLKHIPNIKFLDKNPAGIPLPWMNAT